MANVFTPGRLYIRTNWRILVGPHDLTDVYRSDARLMGLAIEHLLRREFQNLRPPPGKQRPVDLLETHPDGCRAWEVKTTRGSRINLQPSYAKGAGRKHDSARFANTIEMLFGFILVDQRDLPAVSFRGLSVEEIRAYCDGEVPRAISIDAIYEAV